MRYIVLALFVIGCGESAAPDDLADTSWMSPIETSYCARVFVFGPSNYTYSLGCILPDDGNMQISYIERGSYFIDGDRLMLTALDTSCPDQATQQKTVSYLATPAGLTIDGAPFGRLGPTVMLSDRLTTGCFDSGMAFTPSPIVPL